MAGLIERAGFAFIPGPFQYSAGVIARPGATIERARFLRPVPLMDGFARIEAFMAAVGLPLTAFCACDCARRRRASIRSSPTIWCARAPLRAARPGISAGRR